MKVIRFSHIFHVLPKRTASCCKLQRYYITNFIAWLTVMRRWTIEIFFIIFFLWGLCFFKNGGAWSKLLYTNLFRGVSRYWSMNLIFKFSKNLSSQSSIFLLFSFFLKHWIKGTFWSVSHGNFVSLKFPFSFPFEEFLMVEPILKLLFTIYLTFTYELFF